MGIYIKQCECGSTEFERESDDDVLRCAKCNKLAKLGWMHPFNNKKSEEKEDAE